MLRFMSGCALAALTMPAATFAQTAAPASAAPESDGQMPELGDIIVTAQKRSESSNRVPLSITAISGDQLARQGIVSIADLTKVAPGLTFTESRSGYPIYSIRGIGFFEDTPGVSPTVSVYVDEVPLPFAVMTRGAALDLERVEVLKGPQGTLFGQNSTGGAINYVAAKPTDTFKAGTDFTIGRYGQLDVQGFVSAPLTDTLGVRVAARSENRFTGWQEASLPGDDRKLGKQHLQIGRMILDWKPTSALTAVLSVNGWIDKSDVRAWQFRAYSPLAAGGQAAQAAVLPTYPVSPETPTAAEWDRGTDMSRNDSFWQIALRADWTVAPNVTITSTTAYSKLKLEVPSDADGTDFSDIYLVTNAPVRSFSQELRLSGNLDSGVKWLLGVNYQDDAAEEDRVFTNFRASNSGIRLGPNNFQYNNFNERNYQYIKTYAAFANLEVPLTSSLSVQGSGRYTKQDRDYEGCLLDTGAGDLAAAFSALSSATSGSPTTIAPGACVTLGANRKPVSVVASSLDEDNVSWRAGLNWKAGRQTLVYGNVTKGYKAGGYSTLPAASATQLNPVGQESVLAYEVGLKSSITSSVQINGALFYYDYKDKQISGYVNTGFPFGSLPGLVSIPKSSVSGGELNVIARPLRDLRVTLGATYVKTKIADGFVTGDPFGRPTDVGGQAFPNTPKWTLTADAEYRTTLSDRWDGFLGGNVLFYSSTNGQLGDRPQFGIDAYATVDLRAGVETQDGQWRVQAFGRNVTNTYYWLSVVKPTDTISRLAGMPRTYGLTVSRRY